MAEVRSSKVARRSLVKKRPSRLITNTNTAPAVRTPVHSRSDRRSKRSRNAWICRSRIISSSSWAGGVDGQGELLEIGRLLAFGVVARRRRRDRGHLAFLHLLEAFDLAQRARQIVVLL